MAGLVSLASSVTASATGASLTASGLASGSAGTGSMLTGASFSVVVIFVNKWSEIWSRAVGSSLPRSVWSASGESGLSLRRVGASWKSGAVVRGKTCARLCRRDASDGSRGHLMSSRCFSGTQKRVDRHAPADQSVRQPLLLPAPPLFSRDGQHSGSNEGTSPGRRVAAGFDALDPAGRRGDALPPRNARIAAERRLARAPRRALLVLRPIPPGPSRSRC